jgi:type I restriction enzyme S subunit
MASLADLVGSDGIFADGDWVESKDQDPDGDTRLIQLADVGDGLFRNRSNRYMTTEKVVQLRCTLLQKGDILVARMPDPLGRACLYPGSKRPAVTVVDVCIIRPGRNGVDSRWLMWAINSPEVRQQISSFQTGTTRKRISRKNLGGIKIAVPPFAEQGRIAEAIEGYASVLGASESILTSARMRSGLLLRSTIESAMNGRFAQESSEDEPVGALIERLRKKNSLKATSGKKHAPEHRKLSAHINLPSHWTVQPLALLADNIEYGTSAKADAEPGETKIPVLRMGNIQDGHLDLTNLKYLPESHPDASKLRLRDGDLLFNRTNSAELVGKAAVYHSKLGPATFASYLIRVQLAAGIEPEWVSLCINSPEGRRYINSVAAQQVGQANVNGTKLAAFPIPVPPHGEQLRLLAEVSEWRDKVERIAAVTERCLKRSVHLRRSLLHQAISGRLVPQDSDDEPAPMLLARIRAERAPQLSKSARVTRRPTRGSATKMAPPPTRSSDSAPTVAIQQELPL